MRTRYGLVLGLMAGTLLLAAAGLHALAGAAHAQPGISESDPADGATLAQPPEVVRLCFSEPVKKADPSDFSFALRSPDGRRLGLRIAFEPKAQCVDIHPGQAHETEGEWTLEWEVASSANGDVGSGTLRFTVREGATPSAPTATATPEPTPAAPGSGSGEGEDGPDILAVALITTGAALGAAVLGLLFYLLRLRIGFWLHRPPPPADNDH